MEKMKISPPWVTYYRELNEFFNEDADITVEFDEDKKEITIKTTRYEKNLALKKVLQREKDFGGVKLKINVIYDDPEIDALNAFKQLSIDNPVFKYICTFPTSTNPISYVMLAKEVVQYWNDDLSDPHGITSTLYENIARNIFKEDEGIIFSTDSEETFGWMEKAEDDEDEDDEEVRN